MVYVQKVLDRMRACVIIPTYNEARNIGNLARQIRQHGLEAVVVDDGSRDATSQIAKDNGSVVLRNETNEGKGASLIKGFHYALENNFDAVITMDGDGQHLSSDIPYFLRLAKYSDSAIFIGNRMNKPGSMPWVRLATNKFMSWFISKIAQQHIPDTQCGFRLIKKDILNKLILNTRKYETESEILIKASKLGFKIESIPIKAIYADEKSQINPFVDTLRFIGFIFREIWTTRF